MPLQTKNEGLSSFVAFIKYGNKLCIFCISPAVKQSEPINGNLIHFDLWINYQSITKKHPCFDTYIRVFLLHLLYKRTLFNVTNYEDDRLLFALEGISSKCILPSNDLTLGHNTAPVYQTHCSPSFLTSAPSIKDPLPLLLPLLLSLDH